VTFLAVRGLSKVFGATVVLRSLDLELRAGEIVGLLGENGAGKSTFAHTLAGNLRPDGGEIRIDGGLTQFRSVADSLRAGIRLVPQEPSVVGALSVAENILLGDLPTTRAGFVDSRALRRQARLALARIGAAHIDPVVETGALRPGDQKLVEIARATHHQARLIILDEPTAALTAREAGAFLEFVRAVAAAGTAVVFVTHRLTEALDVCHRLVVLRDGALVVDRAAAGAAREELIEAMTGRSARPEAAHQGRQSAAVALSLQDAGDGFRLRGISLEVGRGEILGLFGLIGAGRTELLELLMGVRPLRSGRVTLGSGRGGCRSPREAWRARLALVAEGRKCCGILPQHSVRRNASLSSLGRLVRHGLVSGRAERVQAGAQCAKLGVKMASDAQAISTLSGGNQQKVLFARALMTEPSILLLDEPTQGIDVAARSEIHAAIQAAAAQGVTVVVASSETEELVRLCDRVAVLSKGGLAGVLGRAEMTEQAILTLAFTGQ